MRKVSAFLAVGAACGAFAFASPGAAADEREVCVQAADQAQQLRDEGKYRKAREQMLVCSRDVCPSAVKRDCGEWLTELDKTAPSIVVSAREGNQDISAVKIFVDNVLLTEKLDGKPLTVDPGEHTFRYEKAGSASKEEKLVIRVGEKNRLVNVTFDKGAPASSSSGGSSSGGSSSGGSSSGGGSSPSGGGGGVPVLSFVLGGVGVAGLAGFTVLGLMGKGDVDDMKKDPKDGGCAPNCPDDRVSSAKRKLLFADISLGVGVAGLAGAVIVYVLQPKAEVKTGLHHVDFVPLPGGGAASVGGAF